MTLSAAEFCKAIKQFVDISRKCNDTWQVLEPDSHDMHKCLLKKEEFIKDIDGNFCKAEYTIFYNISYGVPSFSFNIWKSDGTLLSLEEIRHLSPTVIKKEDFYSVVTQQEHPLFHRPYYIVHPCNTESILSALSSSQNIILTFLSLITPIVKLDVDEYGKYIF
ncbi:ubiquitin-like-conjugating enzyme ATG10 [Aricia agestis]|uniref:ubiquitin-like-conjugating enzyme ATG10 n=1 Tax=Aricia agestis TaxID=91739 RepID=UPI001C2017E8|nr:ubiquitin-like-conjugating enzyme ATG10 [Aricia agestis]